LIINEAIVKQLDLFPEFSGKLCGQMSFVKKDLWLILGSGANLRIYRVIGEARTAGQTFALRSDGTASIVSPGHVLADNKELADVTDGPFSQFESWKKGSVHGGEHFGNPYSQIMTFPLMSSADEPGDGGGGKEGGGSGTSVITRTRTQTRKPSLYRVLLLNDDYTPMEFVVTVLKKYFNKGPEEATRIMLHVHQHGVGECGVFTYEVAETKVTQVMDYARKHQHPLQCIMEKN